MFFVNKVKKYIKDGRTNEEAIDLAIDDCIKNEILIEILKKHKADTEGVQSW